jgi:hypothetical protein
MIGKSSEFLNLISNFQNQKTLLSAKKDFYFSFDTFFRKKNCPPPEIKRWAGLFLFASRQNEKKVKNGFTGRTYGALTYLTC